ncbi:hypothetical protein D5018_05885 [Parashewanella curva]|uniref:Uncharacterized protein n=1 Tax=Parashewanella curva TaxID=2338552 RepID=A0A3L8PZQ0_9GAMM|nr:hypothetical protein [Parashewanella curva]RLV60630.1 hypothetical protein D5018_05885 [Parashewanella curva]
MANKLLKLSFLTMACLFSKVTLAQQICLGDPGTPAKLGDGTKSNPYKLVLGYDFCDITLVNKADEDPSAKNKSYPEDSIYFQYDYSDIPYTSLGGNALTVSMVVNEKSSAEFSVVQETPNAKCALAEDNQPEKESGYKYKYYDGGCIYTKPENEGNDFSGSIVFKVSISKSQKIKRFIDKNGNLEKGPHGGLLGAGVIEFKWVTPPQYSNFFIK